MKHALKVIILLCIALNCTLSVAVDAASLPRASEIRVQERLKAIGFTEPLRIYLRLFKQEKTLEVWLQSRGSYKLYKSFEICKYSGKLGPKVAEGDKQAPEGFYHVPAKDVLWNSRKWPRALNLAFPNIYDGLQKRTGSYLLIHGGCSSVGCYALKNGPMSLLYDLVALSLKQGQGVIPIHIFPFRLTSEKLAIHKNHKFLNLWKKMQPVFLSFNEKRTLPSILVCKTGYQVYASSEFVDDPSFTQHGCLQPLPLGSEVVPRKPSLTWVSKLQDEYKTLLKRTRRQIVQKGPQIRVRCNLKLPSCKRWLALRKRMLKRRTLPKSLLR
ncbi:MAG: hypothetical protein JJ964_15875 [Rhizobiales bacterium]|nr:hypothetical protein [Hyphomicrobiales bacterium]